MENQDNKNETGPKMARFYLDEAELTSYIKAKTGDLDRMQVEELIKELGITKDTLDNWLSGKYPKAFGLFVALHRALLLPLDSPVVKRKAN